VALYRVQTSAAALGNGTSAFSVSWPAATRPGNLLLLCGWHRNATTWGAPAGWTAIQTLVSSGTGVGLWYIKNSASRSGAETQTLGAVGQWGGVLIEYAGADPTNPLTVSAISAAATTSTTASATPAVTAGVGDQLAVALLAKANSAENFLAAPTNSFNVVIQNVTTANATASNNVVGQLLDKGVNPTTSLVTGSQSTSENFSATAGAARDALGIVATFKVAAPKVGLMGVGS
jgi:hypothetical protein